MILRDIAERQQLSKSYLEQLTLALKNANLVTSSAGRGGGFSLARPAKEIVVGDIVRAAIGEVSVVACVREPDMCGRTSDCPSRKMWVPITRLVDSVLENTTWRRARCRSSLKSSARRFPVPPTDPPRTQDHSTGRPTRPSKRTTR